MLPLFPKFKKLELSDRDDIKRITSRFPPYSDFNFISMWSWDTEQNIEISLCNDNLVVRFDDYINGQPFYSFLGSNELDKTAHELITMSKTQGYGSLLKLMPEVVVSQLDPQQFTIEEDRDQFDYVYMLDKLTNYKGNKLKAKRNFVNRFLKKYSPIVRTLSIRESDVQKDIISLFDHWAQDKKLGTEDTKREKNAMQRLFSLNDTENIITIALYLEGTMISFVIFEQIIGKYSILHFEKALKKFVGIYSYLMQVTAECMLKNGSKMFNFEQDLGIEGLRKSKKSFFPDNFLKKYKIFYR